MFNWLFKMLLNKAKDWLLTNWKTSLISILAWVFAHFFKFDDQMTAEVLKLVTDIILPIGIVAKDADKSGTVAHPREVAKVDAALSVEPPGFNP